MKYLLTLLLSFTLVSCVVEDNCYEARECVDVYDYDVYGVRFFSHTECYKTFICDPRPGTVIY